jgi:hypothetical protein
MFMIRLSILALLMLNCTYAYSQTTPAQQLVPKELQEQKKELKQQLKVLLQHSLQTLQTQQVVCEQIKTLKEPASQEAKQQSYQDCQKELDKLTLTIAKLKSKIKVLESN